MAYLARADRIALCSLMDELGPEAPTLSGEWTTADLAAHLVARDVRPDSVPGLVVPALAGWSEKVRLGYKARGFERCVGAIRAGPPRWSPLRLARADRLGNTHEFFVHYEDVRRARPDWTVRDLDPADEDDIWRVLRTFSKRAFRSVPCGVVLRRPDGETPLRPQGNVGRRALIGPPGELLLYAFGRRTRMPT